jgi:hypothetical protein
MGVREVRIERAKDLIQETAAEMRSKARELDALAEHFGQTGELDDMAEAINCVRSLISNLRLDLFVKRSAAIAYLEDPQ